MFDNVWTAFACLRKVVQPFNTCVYCALFSANRFRWDPFECGLTLNFPRKCIHVYYTKRLKRENFKEETVS